MTDRFRTYALPGVDVSFDELSASVQFETVGKGRQGAVLVKTDDEHRVPIVRTTTRYATPAQHFQPIHAHLAAHVREQVSGPLAFNNALIEHYTQAYATMGSHSDQALDLADDSLIAVFSCYRQATNPSRKLVVEPKSGEGVTFDVPLLHHHVVVFSVQTNRQFKHKIVLSAGAPSNDWLGITFRTSKTYLRFLEARPYFADGLPLELASEEQQRAFFRMRRQENEQVDFVYPRITYTVSESDLRPPTMPVS